MGEVISIKDSLLEVQTQVDTSRFFGYQTFIFCNDLTSNNVRLLTFIRRIGEISGTYTSYRWKFGNPSKELDNSEIYHGLIAYNAQGFIQWCIIQSNNWIILAWNDWYSWNIFQPWWIIWIRTIDAESRCHYFNRCMAFKIVLYKRI